MSIATWPLTLEAFLALPETKPASEFIDGQIIQKPMPQGEHSRLQSKLSAVVNQVCENSKIAYAFTELRCSFASASIIPDVAVIRWDKIPREPSGRVANRFFIPPDWSIEILSPDQSTTKVLENLLACSKHGTEMGWLLDPAEEAILLVFPDQRTSLLRGDAVLPTLPEIDLALTVAEVFSWLRF